MRGFSDRCSKENKTMPKTTKAARQQRTVANEVRIGPSAYETIRPKVLSDFESALFQFLRLFDVEHREGTLQYNDYNEYAYCQAFSHACAVLHYLVPENAMPEDVRDIWEQWQNTEG
jgi:hypothetical protein